jgi:hypothetical protein
MGKMHMIFFDALNFSHIPGSKNESYVNIRTRKVPVTRWSIQSGTDEEQAYLGEVLESLELLLGWEGQTAEEVDGVVEVISTAFSKAWDSQAKETRRGKHSNGWWTQECSDSIAVYRASCDADD